MRDDVLQRKQYRIVVQLAHRLGIGEGRARDLFNSTKVCQQLAEPKYGLQLMSDGYILEEIINELRGLLYEED